MSAGEKTVTPRNPQTVLAVATRGVFLVAWVALHRCCCVPVRCAARVGVVTDAQPHHHASRDRSGLCRLHRVVVGIHPAVDVGDSGQIVPELGPTSPGSTPQRAGAQDSRCGPGLIRRVRGAAVAPIAQGLYASMATAMMCRPSSARVRPYPVHAGRSAGAVSSVPVTCAASSARGARPSGHTHRRSHTSRRSHRGRSGCPQRPHSVGASTVIMTRAAVPVLRRPQAQVCGRPRRRAAATTPGSHNPGIEVTQRRCAARWELAAPGCRRHGVPQWRPAV
jgi:hypothetical protein